MRSRKLLFSTPRLSSGAMSSPLSPSHTPARGASGPRFLITASSMRPRLPSRTARRGAASCLPDPPLVRVPAELLHVAVGLEALDPLPHPADVHVVEDR